MLFDALFLLLVLDSFNCCLALMWQHIRQGVRWRMRERYGLAVRGLDLAKVKSVKISLDPFYKDNLAIR